MSQAAKPVLPETLSLTVLQKHTKDVCDYFGWSDLSDDEVFLLFTEEIGEMAKGIRKIKRLAEEKAKASATEEERRAHLAEEMADVLSYLADLANRYGVDLDKAYRAKTEHNFSREWGA